MLLLLHAIDNLTKTQPMGISSHTLSKEKSSFSAVSIVLNLD
jgi:hypothetical protein